MAEELGERTEMPSGRKRSESRKQGQVARSALLSSSVGLFAGMILLMVFGASLFAGMAGIVRHALDARLSGSPTALEGVIDCISWAGAHAGILIAPMLSIMVVIAVIVEVGQVGWEPTLEPLQPKLNKLNPFTGFGKLFSRRNTVKTGVSSLQLTGMVVIAVIIVVVEWDAILRLPVLELRPMLAELLRILWRVCIWILSVLLIIGFIDWAYHRWQLTEDLRMTKQEVKEEQKMMEGDMSLKGKRLRLARQIALQQVKGAVPKADVVVTNPTHFAVALKYDADSMAAPKVVAKGADFLAFRIREIAAANNIPIVERPPLARALYAGVAVGKPIKPEFYEAVAEILAYVYRIAGRAA